MLLLYSAMLLVAGGKTIRTLLLLAGF